MPSWDPDKRVWVRGTTICDQSIDSPMPDEHVDAGHLPYHWEERKEKVMKRMPNVLNWVQPFGSTVAYHASNVNANSSKELAWIMSTQHMDLAPQWQEFAANGIRAGSLNNQENGVEENIDYPDLELSTALADVYISGRREQWARERDYQTWHTTPIRRADVRPTESGKFTAKPRWGSEFTRDELLHLIRQTKAALAQPDPEPLTKEWSDDRDWLNDLDRDNARDAFRIQDEIDRYDEDRIGYAAGEPCPWSTVIALDIVMCQSGQSPVFDENYEVADWAPCPICHGDAIVQNVIGTTMSTVDGDEYIDAA